MRNVYILATLACLFATPLAHAQLGSLCGNAAPLCASTGITYNNITGDPPGDPGLGAYNCLSTTPNANMFYLQIDNPGTINLTISQTSGDVDFMLWGPFSSPSAGCAAIVANPAANNVDCSYSTAATEYPDITNAPAGAYYMLLVTNYINQPGTISVIQSGGNGSTNCGILSNAQNNGPICENEILLLEGEDGNSGSGPYTYNWYLLPDFTNSINNTTNFAFSPPSPGTYQFAFVLMDQTTFEADTAYTTAIVHPIPAAPSFSSTAPACEGSPVSMTPDSLIPGAIYAWSGTNGFTSNQPTVNFANANPALFNADYTLTVTVNGCTSPPFTQALMVYDTEVPVVTGPTEVCEGQTVPLSVSNGSDFVSFAWNGVAGSNPQQVPGGSYTVTATDAHGCQTTSTPAYVVDLIDNPLDITGPDHFCEGSPITLSATPGKQSYYWTSGGTGTGETTEVSQGGWVIVSVVSQEGCERSDSLLVTMYDKPDAAFSPLMSCDSSVTFQNDTELSDTSGSVQQLWGWNFGHINPDSTQAVSNLEEPTHVFPAPGTYNVTFTVESNHGCTDQVLVAFLVVQKPIVNFEFESLCFAEGQFLNLTQKGSNGVQTVAWDFGDGTAPSNSADSVLYHSYPSISSYDATLTVTDSAGCVSSLTKPISLKDTPVFEEIPNALTPNGDNVNDEFKFLPVYEDCFDYSFIVYNRWGAKVFETSSADKGFGGESGLGSNLKDGVYFWVLIANGTGNGQGEKVLKNGTITVFASGTK